MPLANFRFVLAQNIDTDQIIPAEYLTLVPSKVRLSAAANPVTTCTSSDCAQQRGQRSRLAAVAVAVLLCTSHD